MPIDEIQKAGRYRGKLGSRELRPSPRRIQYLVTTGQSSPKLVTDLAIQPLGEHINPNKHRQIGDPHVGQVEL